MKYEQQQIGVAGIGRMGKNVSSNIERNDYTLSIYNRLFCYYITSASTKSLFGGYIYERVDREGVFPFDWYTNDGEAELRS